MSRVALITGAARGIGLETARQLHARGWTVALAGLEPEQLEHQAELLGERAAPFTVDVTDADGVDAMVEAVIERFGRIDAVVANAGVGAFGTVAAMAPADWERTIEVNLVGVWRTVRATLPEIVARRGYVLCVSSLSAIAPLGLMSAYTASKAGVEAFASSLRQELMAKGVDVGIVYLGFVDTAMVSEGFEHPSVTPALSGAPRFLAKPMPLAVAGQTLTEAVERRKTRAWAPRWVGPMMALRGILVPLFERRNGTQAGMIEAARISDEAALRGAELPGATVADRGFSPSSSSERR
jgi:NAD(P)-dependent dehydrogenase (short-subunit alcohol dehydrogenase family)